MWTVGLEELNPHHPLVALRAPDGQVTPLQLDVAGVPRMDPAVPRAVFPAHAS